MSTQPNETPKTAEAAQKTAQALTPIAVVLEAPSTTSPAASLGDVRNSQGEEQALGVRVIHLAQPRADTSIGLVLIGHELPRFVHWGRYLPDSSALFDTVLAQHPQRVSGALNSTAWPSVLPTQAEAWTGSRRVVLRREGIELFPQFIVTTAKVRVYKGVAQVQVEAIDSESALSLMWEAELLPSGLVRQRTTVSPSASSTAPLEVGKIELGYPVPSVVDEVLTTTGHHLRERSPQRQKLTIGRFEKEALVGRPDFDASLLLSVGAHGFGFEAGEVYSTHVGWSGNSTISVERTPYTQPLIGGGEVLYGGEIVLSNGESYVTPWVYGSWGTGLNEVAHRFHETLRAQHPNIAGKPRPVILNTWEAVYFDHSFATLSALADKAQECGIERFVVDDGWFHSRRDDTAGLGDWWVDPAVWPEGLEPLSEHVHSLGMEFGLWFEPEMVNPNSDTARSHPDWVLAPNSQRLPMEGRSQQVLDLTNPQAYSYIRDAMVELVGRIGIDYIKWDHNRFVVEAASPLTGRPAVHNQTLAVYRLFEELKTAFPGLEIESCSSGGGRIDMGILELADRVWVSDCVDPVERVDIQRYTSLLVPPEMMGCHVGASPAHSTARATSLSMRAATAFFGHFGVEWNLLAVGQAQLDELGKWVKQFKQYRELFATGALVHADSADSSTRLDGVVALDGAQAVFRFTQLSSSQAYPPSLVRLPGLEKSAVYRLRPLGVSSNLEGIETGQSPLLWWNERGVTLPTQILENLGIRPPQLNPAQAVIFVAEKEASTVK